MDLHCGRNSRNLEDNFQYVRANPISKQKDGEKEWQSILDKLNSQAAATRGYLRVRIAWTIAVLCFFCGFILGHLR